MTTCWLCMTWSPAERWLTTSSSSSTWRVLLLPFASAAALLQTMRAKLLMPGRGQTQQQQQQSSSSSSRGSKPLLHTDGCSNCAREGGVVVLKGEGGSSQAACCGICAPSTCRLVMQVVVVPLNACCWQVVPQPRWVALFTCIEHFKPAVSATKLDCGQLECRA